MANKDSGKPHGEDVPGADGSEANPASDPNSPEDEFAAEAEVSGEDDLTVDEILGTAQTAEAADADGEAADTGENDLMTDLKRVQAEYANYRRRTEEQREIEIERAKGSVATSLLPVLDDLDRAQQHGDLQDGTPFAAIAEKLRSIAERMGLNSFGEVGEPFDPQQHEAIFQAPTEGVTEPSVLEVVEPGYRLGTVELRPAKVVVAVPTE